MNETLNHVLKTIAELHGKVESSGKLPSELREQTLKRLGEMYRELGDLQKLLQQLA